MSILTHVAGICRDERKSWKLGHGALTADFRVGYSSGLMTITAVLWITQYWSKELWVKVKLKTNLYSANKSEDSEALVNIYASYSGRLYNTWIVGRQIYCKVN